MSINIRSISVIVDDSALVVMPNPDKILVGFFTPDTKYDLSSESLYAVKASNIKKIKHLEGMNLLVHENVPLTPDIFSVPNLNLIVVKDAGIFNDLRYRIQKIFDDQAYISNCAYALMELIRSNASIHKFLDAAYSFLTNPIFLFDTSSVIIDHIGFNSRITDPVIIDMKENGALPVSFIKKETEHYIKNDDDDLPDYLSYETLTLNGHSTKAITGHVERGDRIFGTIRLFECNHPMTFVEKNILVIVAQFISVLIYNGSMSASLLNIHMDDFLNDMLSQKLTTKEAITARANLLSINENRDMRVLLIKSNILKINESNMYMLKKRFQAMFGVSTVTIFNPYIVVVTPVSIFEDVKDILIDFLKDNSLICGVSLVFQSFSNLFRQYTQAQACLKLQPEFAPDEVLVFYNDYKFYHLLLHFEECCSLTDLIPPSVNILKEYDNTHGTSLLETLFTYIHCRSSITEAASKMHLHYNTMKYRIAQIGELAHINFDNYKDMFDIQIAEKVMAVHKKANIEL